MSVLLKGIHVFSYSDIMGLNILEVLYKWEKSQELMLKVFSQIGCLVYPLCEGM